MNPILSIKNLAVSFPKPQGELTALRNVSLDLYPQETLAIVGESGSGKSILCKSAMGLLPSTAVLKSGSIHLNNLNITQLTEHQLQKIRGKQCSMIFQDSMLSLNPVISVGEQLVEAILADEKITYTKAKRKAIELMTLVNIDFAEDRFHLKPHCFSGGMLQRLVIAIAIAQKPKILFADEPTTALDASTKLQTLDLLMQLKTKLNMSIVFISHDLGTIARIADKVAIMYAGKIIEFGLATDIFYHPAHPYTRALLSAQPSLNTEKKRLDTLPGMPPIMINLPQGDAFAPRNQYALNIDYIEHPPFYDLSPTHKVASWLYDDNAPKILPQWELIKD